MSLILNNSQTITVNSLKPAIAEGFTNGVQNPSHSPDVDSSVTSAQNWSNGPPDGPTAAQQDAGYGIMLNQFAAMISALYGTPWLTPNTFTSGWTAGSDPTYYTSQYKRNGLGAVKLRGLVIKDPTVLGASTIFVLPVGFRPSKSMVFNVRNNGLNAEIRIDPNGSVVATVGVFTATTGTWYLDSIQFEVDT